MRLIGLDIKVKNKYSDYLNQLFKGIDLSNYLWEINADNILYSDNGEKKVNLFGADVLTGEEFGKCISRDNYYMIFADIKAYPLDRERIEIKTFEDFMKSNCEMTLLCTDSAYIEFYSKSIEILDKVYNNSKGSNFENAELRSVEEISGRQFIAW